MINSTNKLYFQEDRCDPFMSAKYYKEEENFNVNRDIADEHLKEYQNDYGILYRLMRI